MTSMQLGLTQHVRMEQRLVQSPRMIQAMLVLQLSTLELERRVEQELLENPLLEREDAPRAQAGDDPVVSADAVRREFAHAPRSTRERDGWDRAPRERRSSFGESDGKHEALQNSPDRYRSLGASLLDQLALIEFDSRQSRIVEFILCSLDWRGYLPCSVALLAGESTIDGVTEAEFAFVLTAIRHATHPALGAHDLRECLLLQVSDENQRDTLVRTLIVDRLEDVAANRLPHIAQSTGCSIAEVGHAIDFLRTLDPFPGSAYGEAPAEVIRPDVVVENVDGEVQVRLTHRGACAVRLSSDYASVLRNGSRRDSTSKWIRRHLASARWFIDALEQRRDTLLRIARAIFERQRRFLEQGRGALAPMRMCEIADAVGVHLSTVSRAVSGKYVQTPQGILRLRSFFSGGMAKTGGGTVSQASIQEQVRRLIQEEDPSHPHSDERLVGLLLARGGVSLARRTVTKYRRTLEIPSSRKRRVF